MTFLPCLLVVSTLTMIFPFSCQLNWNFITRKHHPHNLYVEEQQLHPVHWCWCSCLPRWYVLILNWGTLLLGKLREIHHLGNAACNNKKAHTIPCHLQLAIKNDEEYVIIISVSIWYAKVDRYCPCRLNKLLGSTNTGLHVMKPQKSACGWGITWDVFLCYICGAAGSYYYNV